MKIKTNEFVQRFYKAAEKLMILVPDWLTGDSKVMHKKYRVKYGLRDCNQIIRQKKTKIMAAYLLIVISFVILFGSSIVLQMVEGKQINIIKRPGSGDAAITIPVEVKMNYKGYELTKAINLQVKEKSLTENEKQKKLQDFKKKLGQLILGENKDLQHISKPLNLIEQDIDSGITVSWKADQPEIIDEKGFVDLLEAKDKQAVTLEAEITLDDITVNEKYHLKIDTDVSQEDYSQSMDRTLGEIIEQMSENSSSSHMRLPEELSSGIQVKWFVGKSDNGVLIVLIFMIAILIVYFKRYDQINKEIKDAEESIIRDLPEFMNKLVLLLNAGLVVSTAFSKIVADYELFHRGLEQQVKAKRYLYDELCEIQKRVDQSNASLIKELKEFSQRSGVRELVRLTAVISDNWNKGSMLAEKLEGESELLWVSRKKRAEEKGKLAETKLTFPLMILLIVLIMVTIAPAMMEM